jgi:hypothetical protein
MFVCGLLALVLALDLLRLPTGAAPVRLALVMLALAVGLALSVALDRPGARPYWQMGLFSSLILMPTVGLQSSASRVPFVTLSRGSAGPMLWLTLATLVILLVLWLFAALQSDRTPEEGALLFLPAAVLVPAMMGAPGALDETSALSMLGEAALLAGVAIFIGLLAPDNWRPVTGGFALGAQFVLLWALGQGPVSGTDSGAIVPVCAAILLATTTLMTVLTPLLALFSRRFLQTVEDESGGRKPPPVPPRGAVQSDVR